MVFILWFQGLWSSISETPCVIKKYIDNKKLKLKLVTRKSNEIIDKH